MFLEPNIKTKNFAFDRKLQFWPESIILDGRNRDGRTEKLGKEQASLTGAGAWAELGKIANS